MRPSIAASLLLAVVPALTLSQELAMEPGPKSPAESLKAILLSPGFKAELMACEPIVHSPIAFAWGADGKFWVVEMGDYPLGIDGKGKPGGRIKILEKTHADGPYDKMTVFMDGLGFPTGVLPYGKGVLVTCAPDIFYAEDTDGDGKADKKEVLFTGFREGNQQHRVNGLTWGIDNWIYGANGDSGGMVKSLKTGKVVDIRGRDFRLKVETGEFETQSGQSQFGRCRDDWGNWFGNNNSHPMYHYVLDDHYLKRNPYVVYPDPKVQVSVNPGAAEVFPISKALPRFNSPQALNHFTSACSTIVYRDVLFGKEFAGNMFVSEPVHNLIHREVMTQTGVTFTSRRTDFEQRSEFLASTDNWFRPTMIQTGPDGALWIADMYRYVIEHPQWIPKDWQKKLDLRAGHDKGRIYRVYPVGKKLPDTPRIDKMSTSKLIAALEHSNGWVRDTAHREIVQRSPGRTELGALGRILTDSHWPQARLHALSIFDGLGILDKGEFQSITNSILGKERHPGVKKHIVRLHTPNSKEEYLNDDNPEVRMQYGYGLGEWKTKRGGEFLGRYLLENSDDRYLLAAGLSSITKENWPEVLAAVTKSKHLPVALFAPFVRIAQAQETDPVEVAKLFIRQLDAQGLSTIQQIRQLGEMLDAVDNSKTTVKALLQSAGAENAENTMARLKQIQGAAAKMVGDPKSSKADKLVAVRVLACGLADDRADHKILTALLTPRTPDDLQSVVIQQLGRKFDYRAPELLLAPWKTYSPKLRGQVLDILLSRPTWVRMTLEALEKKQLPAQEIDATRRQQLLHHREEGIRLKALKIFNAPSNSDRGQIAAEYWLQLPDKGDATRGMKLFTKTCASCHKLGGVGEHVGPDLASVGDRSPQGLLNAILDPNRAVESRYISYLAVTKSGLTHIGILASETSTNITLIAADGKKHELLRTELEELSSTGKSMMPEGLEKDLSPKDLADVIEFVRGNQQAFKRKEFPGNEPEKVVADKDGLLFLLPKNAAIFGPKIVLEKQLGNLGWWSSPEDHADWSVDVPSAGAYRVWITYACANDSAGNTLSIRAGDARLLHKVGGTGSWENYHALEIGALELKAGTQEVSLRADGILRNALFDLKEVKLIPR